MKESYFEDLPELPELNLNIREELNDEIDDDYDEDEEYSDLFEDSDDIY